MHVCVPFVANPEPSECMKPGKGTFDEPARFTEAAAVRRTDFGKQGRDAAFAQTLPVRLGTVVPVAQNNLRFAQRPSALSSDGRNRLNQRIDLRDVVAIRGSQEDREQDPLRVDDEVVLAAELAPVRWVRAGFFPRASRGPTNCRQSRVPCRVGHDGVTPPAALRGCVARHRPLATPPAAASTPYLSRSPFLAAADSRRCPSAARIRCRSTPLGLASACAQRIGGSVVPASAVEVR